MPHSIILTILLLFCALQTICADPSESSERRGPGFGYRRYRGRETHGPRWGWNWNRAGTAGAPFNTETSPGQRVSSITTLAPNLQPNPQHALAKLSTISSTLAPSSPLPQGLNVLRGGASGANNAPMFNIPSAGLGLGPAAGGAGAGAGAAAAAASNLIPTMAAVAAAATPVRGQSPFPYQPTDFVDPTNNPTGRVPEQPQASCGPMEFQCQAYQQCYPCYTNTGLPQCMTCLGLMRCTDANCQLKQMCNLCRAASSMAVCPMAQPYCPL